MGRKADRKAAKRREKESRGRLTPGSLDEIFVGSPTSAGEHVDEFTAVSYSAVYRAVALIAGVCSTLPIHVYRRTPDGKERLADHVVEELLNVSPNDETDSCAWRETNLAHCLLWGKGPAEVERDKLGRPLALWLVEPWRFHPFRGEDYRLRYQVDPLAGRPDSGGVFGTADFVHLAGLGFDGITGFSPIRLAREAIGLGMAAEKYGAKVFGEGGIPAGVYEYPGVLSAERFEQLKGRLRRDHGGPDGARRTAILEGGMKFSAISLPPEDAQFLETRKFQVSEIARWYGVPPHLLGDLERATFSNIEEQNLEFLAFCLRGWLTRVEQAYSRRLLTPEERKAGLFLEHRTEDLLRGNTAARYAAFGVGRNNGFLSVNEIRAADNRNGIGPAGDSYLVPVNMSVIHPGDPQPQPVAGAAPSTPPPAAASAGAAESTSAEETVP